MNVSLLSLCFLLPLVGMLLSGIVMIVRSGKGRLSHPSCGRCGYDLTGFSTESDACPECGGKYTEAGIIPARPGRRKGMLRWGIVLVLLPVLFVGSSVVITMIYLNAAQVEANRARQQAQLATLRQQALALALKFDAAKQERDQATDEAVIAELEATLAELADQLKMAESQLKSMEQQQEGE